MKEKVVIIFIALVAGLLITTVAFYLYQSSKNISEDELKKAAVKTQVTPKPTSNIFLIVDEPRDESLSDRRTIQIKGKTNPENTIMVSSFLEDVIVSPTQDGNFSITLGIDAQVNKITIRAISPSGEEAMEERIITYNQEEF